MKPWWKVAVPHEDIRKGRLDPSMSAIDPGDASLGGTSSECGDGQAHAICDRTVAVRGLDQPGVRSRPSLPTVAVTQETTRHLLRKIVEVLTRLDRDG